MKVRRSISILTLIFVTATLLVRQSSPATAQSDVITANPTPITVELSGAEPAPSGVVNEITFAAQGGGDHITEEFQESPTFPKPSWSSVPTYGPGTFSVCGYTKTSAPIAMLRLPSGTEQELPLKAGFIAGCWTGETAPINYYVVSDQLSYYKIGMEFGLYTLDIMHSQGNLSYSWAVGYPLCETVKRLDENTFWLMGFKSKQNVNLLFYALQTYQNRNDQEQYLAQRNVNTDEAGSLLVKLNIGHAAAVKASNIRLGLITDGNKYLYALDPFYLGVTYFGPIRPSGTTKFLPVRESIPAKFNTYHTLVRDYQGDVSACLGDFSNPGTRNKYLDGNFNGGRYAQVNTVDKNEANLYSTYNNRDKPSGSIPNGDPVEVLESRSTFDQSKPIIWHHVRSEDGVEGWIDGEMLLTAVPELPKPGMQAVVLAGANSNVVRENIYLFEHPSPNSRKIVEVSGKHVVILAKDPPGETHNNAYGVSQEWFFVRADSGEQGWMLNPIEPDQSISLITLRTLPWKPVSVVGFTLPPTSTPAPKPTAYKACPNSLPTNLFIGAQAIVLPGDPNNLRDTPDGKILGVLDVGEQFTVLEGPKCSKKGITFWKVQSGTRVGWTAEANAKSYYVGLAN